MDDQHITTILWRYKLLVAVCVIVAVGAAIGATLVLDKVYEARSTLQVGPPLNRGGGVSPEANQALARSYAEVITSGSFLERIRPELAGRPTVRALQDHVTAEAVPDTGVVRVKAKGQTPEAARELAAAVVASFVASLRTDTAERVRRQQAQVEALVDQLTRRIDRPAPGASPSRIAQLRQSRRALLAEGAGLVTDGVAEAASARRVGPPSASSNPISPRPRLNVVAGIMFGLVMGAGLAWWRERRSLPLRSAEDAAALTDVAVLATIPLVRRATVGDPVLSEAYDVLRANLVFLSPDDTKHVITVVSENARVGKTSTVEGLAYAAARGGSSVVIVDADLRIGDLSLRFGMRGSGGLHDVLVGDLDLTEALITPAPNLAILPAYPPTPDPPALLQGPRTAELIHRLRAQFDLVLIDSPPIAQLADGLILSSLSDGVLMVARSGVTSRPGLIGGVKKVRQTHTPILGLVVFASRDVDSDYYPAMVARRPRLQDASLSR